MTAPAARGGRSRLGAGVRARTRARGSTNEREAYGLSERAAAREPALLRVLAPLRPDLPARLLSAHRQVIRSLDIEPGARVLELGVGTGLSLDAYPPHCQVTGIDLAPDMLERAQDKVNRNGWRHVTLEQGDALDLEFAGRQLRLRDGLPRRQRRAGSAADDGRGAARLPPGRHHHHHQPLPQPERRRSRASRASIDPLTRALGWTTLRLPDVLDRARAARRAPVEDVAALAVHDRRSRATRRRCRRDVAAVARRGSSIAGVSGARRALVPRCRRRARTG